MLSYCTRCGDPLEAGAKCPNDGAPAAPLSTFNTEDPVDKYILEEMLGIGGMGEVWRARHSTIQKKVAIKFLSAKASGDQATALRFKREALAVNQVQHKNIVDIFDFGETKEGRPFFVMELLQGKELAHRLSKQQPLPFSEIIAIITQICRGLQAAHDKGIVHRDLKPENIFLLSEEDGLRVKLLDFGIAKVINEEARVTKATDIFGTPEYMAPEQCEGAKKVDHRADLYSLAVMVFEMLTGKHPFARPGDGPGTIIARQLTMPAPVPSEVNQVRKITAEVDAFVDKALSKNPDERHESASEFLRSLIEAAGELRNEISVTRQDGTQVSAVAPYFTQEEPKLAPTQSTSGDYFVGRPPTVEPPKRATVLPKPKGFLIGAAAVSCLLIGLAIFFVSSSGQSANTPSKETKSDPPPIKSEPTNIAVTSDSKTAAAVVEPVKPATVSFSFDTDPKGVMVFHNKELLCVTPCGATFEAQEKPMNFFFNKKGYEAKNASAVPNQDRVVKAKLTKEEKSNDLILIPLAPKPKK